MIKLSIIFAFTTALLACEPQASRETQVDSEHPDSHQHNDPLEVYYTCSMHPQIREDKPGRCPICNMTLTKVELDPQAATEPKATSSTALWQCKDYPDVTSQRPEACPIDGSPMIRKETTSTANEAIASVKLKKSQLSHFQPSFFPVTTMTMSKEVRLLGSVLQSEDRESTIPARVGGRIEKVYVKSTGSFIKRGDPVVQIYSPKLISAGEEYLISRQSYEKNKQADFEQLVEKARQRLELWGIRPRQYQSWYRQGQVPENIVIYSASTGIVRKHHAKVGKYFQEGGNFFELSDLSEVWVEMDVYEHDSAIVKLGQKVKLEFSSAPGETVESEIDFINPVLDPKSRTLKIRTTVANHDGSLKPGMIAEASLQVIFEGQPLVVPRTAIIDTGKRKVVWLRLDERSFQASIVQTGFESEGYVAIKDGLSEGDQVVIEGNFLLDAQAQLFGGYSDMTKKSQPAHQH